MKKSIFKIASITAFAVLFSLTSCDKAATNVDGADTKKETEEVELKITTPPLLCELLIWKKVSLRL